jgi:hypothetical protein
VLRNAPRMCAHTFRGSTWRSALGFEDERDVFRRYKQRRAAERDYVPDGAELPAPGTRRLRPDDGVQVAPG